MTTLPPNLESVRDHLLRHGPQRCDALAQELRLHGIVLGCERLRALPCRYPDVFGLHDDRLALVGLAAASGVARAVSAADTSPRPLPWSGLGNPGRLDTQRILVTAAAGFELTGSVGANNPPKDAEAAPASWAVFRPWDGGMLCGSGSADPREILQFCAGGAAVAGFGHYSSPDYDVLRAAIGLPELDLTAMAVLVHPESPGRTLDDECDALGVPAPDSDPASRARATGQCLTALLDAVDLSDPSWALARACLLMAGDPLACLLPDLPLPTSLQDVLDCRSDPLLTPTRSAGPSAAMAATAGFEALREGGLAERTGQQEMARAVAGVLDDGGLLAVEAPTGTGKSLAYLVPALGRTSPRPTLIATATKVLQRQLRHDAVRLAERGLAGAPFRQIFGVANYVCTREVAVAASADEPADPAAWLAVAVAVRALAETATGVWDDVTDGPLSVRPHYRQMRALLSTDADSCERAACEFASRCPIQTRLDGIDKQPGVLAINHALLAVWARANLDETRQRPPVTTARDIVVDEAHDLEDSLTAAWTEAVRDRDLEVLGGRIDGRTGLGRGLRDLRRHGHDLTHLVDTADLRRRLQGAARALGSAADVYVHEYAGGEQTAALRRGVVGGRPEFRALAAAGLDVATVLAAVNQACSRLIDHLRSSGMGDMPAARRLRAQAVGVAARAAELGQVLGDLRTMPEEHLWVYLVHAVPPAATQSTGQSHALVPLESVTSSSPAQAPDQGEWRWERAPIEVGPAFEAGVVRPSRSVTLTSATLRTGETFDFIGDRLGVQVAPGAQEAGVFSGLVLDSPFDHHEQSAIILTNHLPLPIPSQEEEFVREVARDQVGFLSLTGGRALGLFAARRRMNAVAQQVREYAAPLAERGVRVMAQGEAGREETARAFRRDLGTVLYGVRSYWQGFDAPGETLSYLVLEKPPYPHPKDALVAARSRVIAERGGDPFAEYVLPRTAIQFAQGFGRMVRTESDRGAALVYDRRMQSPSVANRILLSALHGPTVRLATDRDDAWSFAIRFVTGEEPDLSAALATTAGKMETLLAELRLNPGEDPSEKLTAAARLLFGIEELTPEQLEVMRAHLAGRDVFAVLPTGSGKSLCFQLPALLRPENRATVVVSPLVALIKDQIDELRGRRGLTGVQGITGATSNVIKTEILRDVAAGRVRLLYVSPERLVRDPHLRTALEREQLAGLVVDEAHCISDWGHDFRPEFRQVSAAVAHLQRAPRIALTATATRPVIQDVSATLTMDDPLLVNLPSDRPNLRLRVQQASSERERARSLFRIVTAMGDRPGIVYASRRATTEELAGLLRSAGLTARHYHAGMVPEQREAVQDDYFAGTTQIVVATKAFGMGINKPDIGWVVHYDLPDSLDSYVQEAGRAARHRDLVGECVLLYTGGDIARRKRMLDREGEGDEIGRVRALLAELHRARRRNGDAVFDADELATRLNEEPDDIGILLGWLVRSKAIEQLPDCSARGVLVPGMVDPADPEEARRLRDISARLRTRPMVRTLLDFDRLEDELGFDPDTLERELVSWSLDRIVSYGSSQRYRRVRLLAEQLDERLLADQIAGWRAWQRQQWDALLRYVNGRGCRRSAVLAYYGHTPTPCGPTQEPCDGCSSEQPAWDLLPDARVPDPELLIDVDLIVLQAVAWTMSLTRGRYGERGLRAAVLGQETLGGRPLGRGLSICPQFGALRYVRGAERRWDEAVSRHLAEGRLARESVAREGTAYSSLALTESGKRVMGGRRG